MFYNYFLKQFYVAYVLAYTKLKASQIHNLPKLFVSDWKLNLIL